MSFENTQCPCGWKKPCDTMLCDQCMADLKEHNSMKAFLDLKSPTSYRRQAALVLLTLARKFKRDPYKQPKNELPLKHQSIADHFAGPPTSVAEGGGADLGRTPEPVGA